MNTTQQTTEDEQAELTRLADIEAIDADIEWQAKQAPVAE